MAGAQQAKGLKEAGALGRTGLPAAPCSLALAGGGGRRGLPGSRGNEGMNWLLVAQGSCLASRGGVLLGSAPAGPPPRGSTDNLLWCQKAWAFPHILLPQRHRPILGSSRCFLLGWVGPSHSDQLRTALSDGPHKESTRPGLGPTQIPRTLEGACEPDDPRALHTCTAPAVTHCRGGHHKQQRPL